MRLYSRSGTETQSQPTLSHQFLDGEKAG